MNIEDLAFNTKGIRYSIVPRARHLEVSSNSLTPADEALLDSMIAQGAPSQTYVVRINRTGVTPDAPFRDPRTTFENQRTLFHSLDLSSQQDAAQVHLIGAVTGPYAGQPGKGDEWHGMFLVTRGERPVPTFGELHANELHTLHILMGKTLDFMQRDQLPSGNINGFIGFSFSPLETRRQMSIDLPEVEGRGSILFPRSPVQNIGSVHAHIVKMNSKYLQDSPDSSPEKFDRRMTREPKLDSLVDIFRKLVYEPTLTGGSTVPVEYIEHAEDDTLFPKGILMVFPRDQLHDPEFSSFMGRLHDNAQSAYNRIADIFLDVKLTSSGIVAMRAPQAVRERLDDFMQESDIVALSERAKRFITMLSKLKKPDAMLPPTMSMGERSKEAENLVLLGLAYNLVYYYPTREPGILVVGLEPRWISGASPIETFGIFKDHLSVDKASAEALMEDHRQAGQEWVEHLIELEQSLKRRLPQNARQ
jgi:hypothetical protein